MQAIAQTQRATKCSLVLNLHPFFIDPDFKQIDATKACGAPVIELHTGRYADIETAAERQIELELIIKAAEYASRIGLIVNAGHGLHYHNVQAIAAIDNMNELNIGHAIIARALYTGIAEATKEMKQAMLEA